MCSIQKKRKEKNTESLVTIETHMPVPVAVFTAADGKSVLYTVLQKTQVFLMPESELCTSRILLSKDM